MEIDLRKRYINQIMNAPETRKLPTDDKMRLWDRLRDLPIQELKKNCQLEGEIVRVCWKGHKMTPDNVYFSSGKRRCRECKRRWEFFYSERGIFHDL